MILTVRIAINGIGVVGGFGCGVEDLRRRLQAADLADGARVSEKGDLFPGILGFCAGTTRLGSFVPKRALRRLDHFVRMAVLGGYLAIEDAGFPIDGSEKVGVVVATGYGAAQATFSFLDTVIDDGDACASPTFFASSVHNAAAAYISLLTRAAGPTITVSQFEMSIPAGLLTASRLLEEKKADIVLCGGVDEICPVLGYCWNRFFPVTQRVAIRPLELNRQSAVPGEGAAFFLLSRAGSESPKYGMITGIALGKLGKGEGSVPLNTGMPFFLGLDGKESCSRLYASHIPEGTRVAAYAQNYGSLPVGPAFDMAVAAISLKDGRVYGVPQDAGDHPPWHIIREEQPLGASSVCCVKFDCHGNFGIITLTR